MNSPCPVLTLSVSALDLTDTRYLLAPCYAEPGETLVASMREYGLLHPPLVQEIAANHFIILAGHKRVKAFLQTASTDTIPCLVAQESSSELDILALILEYHLTEGTLSLIEQVALLEKIMSQGPADHALPFLERLGHKANPHTLDQLLALRKLCSAAQLALHEGALTHAGARKILRLSTEDQETIIRLIRQFRLGGSKQQQLIQMATELILRHDQRLEHILADFAPVEQDHPEDNIPQRAAALLKWLHGRCSPRLVEAETRMKSEIARLELPESIQILPSRAFEDDSVSLAINFPDWQSMRRILKDILTSLQPKETKQC